MMFSYLDATKASSTIHFVAFFHKQQLTHFSKHIY